MILGHDSLINLTYSFYCTWLLVKEISVACMLAISFDLFFIRVENRRGLEFCPACLGFWSDFLTTFCCVRAYQTD